MVRRSGQYFDHTGCTRRPRQPGVRRSSEQGQHVERRVRRQCLSLGRDGAEAEGAGLQEPYPQARTPQSSAERCGDRGKLQEEQGAGAHRARVRRPGECARRAARPHDRHRACKDQDRAPEPCLQHPSPGDSGASSRRMTGGVRPLRTDLSVKRPKRRCRRRPGRAETTNRRVPWTADR